MYLDEFLFRHKMTYKQLASQIGMSAAHIAILQNRRSSPSLVAAMNIFYATEGKVTFPELLRDDDVKKLRKKNVPQKVVATE